MSAPILGRVNHAQLELLNLERSPASGETAEDNQGSQNASKRWVKDAADSLQAALDEKSRHDAMLRLYAGISQAALHQGAAAVDIHLLSSTIVTAVLPLDETIEAASRGLTAELALASLILLSPTLNDTALLTVIAYAEEGDPWTTREAARLAAQVITLQLAPESRADFISGPLLQGYIQPKMSPTLSDRLSRSGRPIQFRGSTESSQRGRPDAAWKRHEPPLTTVFGWAVVQANNDLVASKWPLFLPALVAFIGDHDARVRERGLWLVSAFLHKLPTETLRHSGVGDVLQDAIFPTLASLPTLTPEHESAQLLRAAYPVLLQLALADLDAQNWHGWRVLDKILRDGVLESYSHASHYATIAEILMHTAASIVRYLGIRSARHLQGLLGMVESTMTDPFATAHPPALEAAIDLLNSILLYCWPRISRRAHGGRILRAITVCWLNMHDRGQGGYDPGPTNAEPPAKDRIRSSLGLLLAVCEGHEQEMEGIMAEAVVKEPQLAILFAEDTAVKQSKMEESTALPKRSENNMA